MSITMVSYGVRLNFLWDDGDDTQMFRIKVPYATQKEEVEEALQKTHDLLCFHDKYDFYGKEGRTPETLVRHACESYGWIYEQLSFDVDLNLQ